MKREQVLWFAGVVILLSSCYKEYIRYPDQSSGDFNFMMTEEQEASVLNSRGTRLMIENPAPFLYFDDVQYDLDRFQIRGESSLYFRRKSFAVNMDDPFPYIVASENRTRDIEKYKLISLVFDYTYIENCLAIEFFKMVDLWPTFSYYTEVKINNNTQGLYLFIEDPEDYFLYQQNSSFILRREYHHAVENFEVNDLVDPSSSDAYLAQFNSIYSIITKYSGKQVYDSLENLIDLPQYFRKLSIDMFLKNGDFTDEIFFYTKVMDGHEIYGVYPWDYDDLFAQYPHEIGRDWAVGNAFGTRTYATMDDIIADVGEKLLFSIEDDLDYKIASDEYLYGQYLSVLSEVMNTLSIESIDKAFEQVRLQLDPFYDNDEIIVQSHYDVNETNRELYVTNLTDKYNLLIERHDWMVRKINEELNYRKK